MSHTDHHQRPSRRVQRVLGIRASNAAGKHLDRRTQRVRTRAAAKAHAVKEHTS